MAKIPVPKLKPVRKQRDPRYGDVDIFTDQNGTKQYICISRTAMTEDEGKELIRHAVDRQHPKISQYQAPYTTDVVPIQQFCSTFYKARVFLEQMDWSLAQELARRSYRLKDSLKKLKMFHQKNKGRKPTMELGNQGVERQNEVKRQYFTNHQLVSIFYDLITGLAHMQKMGFYHGNLTPDWLIRNSKSWSVTDHPFTDYAEFIPENLKLNPEGKSKFLEFFHKDECGLNSNIQEDIDYLSLDPKMRRFYLSPEQYRLLISNDEYRTPGKSYNMTKSDVYSLGLIVLEAGLMESNNCIFKEYDIDQSLVKAKLSKFGQTYPQNNLVRSVLYKMLQYDALNRPDFIEIEKRLPPRKQIDKWFRKYKDEMAVPQLNFGFNPGHYAHLDSGKNGKYTTQGPDIFAGEQKVFKNDGLASGKNEKFHFSPQRVAKTQAENPYQTQKSSRSGSKPKYNYRYNSPLKTNQFSPKYQLSPKRSPNHKYVNQKRTPYQSPNR